MKRTVLMQEYRKMRFIEALECWTEGRLTQEEAAQLLGVSDRTFRRYLSRYEDEGIDGLIDKRLGQVSWRRAPVDEVMAVTAMYKTYYYGWNVRHFFRFYKRKHTGKRSYTWVKKVLQKEGLVATTGKHGVHRKKTRTSPA